MNADDLIAELGNTPARHYEPLGWVLRTVEDAEVIKKIISLLLGFSPVSQTADAQANNPVSTTGDRWIVYGRVAPDNSPLVVSARTGNAAVETLLRDGLATVVSCRADPNNVNDQGMPHGVDRLYPLEDKLDGEPALLAAGAFHVANVTGQGERRIIFVHRDPVDFASILQTIRVQGFSCGASEVTNREELISVVTPTVLEIQLNADEAVISNLQENGDDGHLPRKTHFWFYGKGKALASLAADLKIYGFSIDHWLSDPTGVVLSREMPVDLVSFRSTTPTILKAVEQSGVEYDGWETPVISQISTQSEGRVDH